MNNIVEGGTIVLNSDDKFFNFFKIKSIKKKIKNNFFWNKK